ncbi:MAG: ATP-dependent Clp protease ATP-binding subunit, partial [Clostridia bacterium]|nr:ATP-dependent Clp protease ATP-binding subunit [Clostridia bacterium]
MYRFTGMTARANDALNYAVQKAQSMGSQRVGSEHLLLGLLRDKDSVAGRALAKYGVTAESAERVLRESEGAALPTSLTPEDFTPRLKHILEAAVVSAGEAGFRLVGTEHLLLALLREEQCFALRLIALSGASAEALREEIDGTTADHTAKTPSGAQLSSTSTLEKFGRDLTALALQGKIDPVIGRQAEIDRVTRILCRRTKNNPCLVGEPGVGKTAIAEGLALKIAEGTVPEPLRNKRVVTLDLTGMVAGTKYRGDFEERIQNAIGEVVSDGNVILFIDEIHTIIGAGAAEGSADAANILKPGLARGELQVIGATTAEESRKHIEKDAALERRFQPVTVGEPDEAETVEILKGLRGCYESHHKVKITDDALKSAVRLSVRYIGDRFLPDKAIDLVDEAAAQVRLRSFVPPELKALEQELKQTVIEKETAVTAQEFERAAVLRDKEKELREKLLRKKEEWRVRESGTLRSVTDEDIAEVVSAWTGVP